MKSSSREQMDKVFLLGNIQFPSDTNSIFPRKIPWNVYWFRNSRQRLVLVVVFLNFYIVIFLSVWRRTHSITISITIVALGIVSREYLPFYKKGLTARYPTQRVIPTALPMPNLLSSSMNSSCGVSAIFNSSHSNCR